MVKIANKFDSSNPLTKEMNELVNKFIAGNSNPGVGSKHLFNGVYELRSRNGARVYYRMVDDTMEILGKSDKNTQQKVIDILMKMYD
ncbi:hypothetical protein Gferi_10350 [Geosporobacter ferrireducens]|uniref:Addiction module toxin RelE n=1 Tax=Geosporobacter ferrireducens TaxID=1424294 RepID=A0A1D8GQ46_9FIRM|nr:hypothetical protein Gferi_10350 [Geosporobacter ferrireducens]